MENPRSQERPGVFCRCWNNLQQALALFRTLFRGREDVYAIRWQRRDRKAGYSPAGVMDWEAVRAAKPEDRKRVTRQTRTLLPLTDQALRDRLLFPSWRVSRVLQMSRRRLILHRE